MGYVGLGERGAEDGVDPVIGKLDFDVLEARFEGLDECAAAWTDAVDYEGGKVGEGGKGRIYALVMGK